MKPIRYYLGATTLLTLLAAILFRSHINLTAASFFPAMVALEMLWMSFRCHILIEFFFKKFQKDSHSKGFYDSSEEEKYAEFWHVLEHNVFLFFVPFVLPFILFFDNAVKISVTSTVMFFPHIAILFVCVRQTAQLVKQAKEKKLQEEKELREQERREQMGQWK